MKLQKSKYGMNYRQPVSTMAVTIQKLDVPTGASFTQATGEAVKTGSLAVITTVITLSTVILASISSELLKT